MFVKASFTFIAIIFSDLTFAIEFHGNQDQLKIYHPPDLAVYSLEELNYETCKINDHRRANQERVYVKNLDLTPENMRPMLVNYMCDLSLGANLSGSPRQLLNPKHYDYKFIDGKHKYLPKSGFRELDFEAEASRFLKEFKSKLENCESGLPRSNCFGAGLVWNGFYLGEWSNEKPQGQGIQLLTRGIPFGFDKKVWNSIYQGAFKDGMFHGEGRLFNLKQAFEGNWFRGEMHGKIDWQWPIIFDFGFSFSRSKLGIVVTEIAPFGPAESAGLQIGDIISTITHETEVIQTDETGIKSINRFLDEITANDAITIQIKDRTFGLVFAFYDDAKAVCTPNTTNYSVKLCQKKYQSYYQTCRAALNNTRGGCKEALDKWVPKIINKEPFNEYLSITFSKSQTSQKDQTAMFCIGNRDEKCYEKSILKNTFTDDGEVSRGSYLMGMKHAYTQDDLHIYKQSDSSATWQLFCHNNKPPFAVITKDKKLLEKIKLVTPSTFIFDTGYNTPCLISKRFPYNANSFAFPHLLKEDQEAMELLSDLSGLYKIDIVDYLDDFIMQLEKGISPNNIKSVAHEWCDYDLLYIYCGYGRSDNSYVIHQKTKIMDNPETAAYKRKKQIQLKRAEENFFIISSCRAKYEDVSLISQFKTCVAYSVKRRIAFWTCVYRGENMSNCSKITNSPTPKEVSSYKVNNPIALRDVNLNEWIFGDL
ncbi:MAG: hypothetical protein VX513_00785 [Pseudomonadota bacterium]|nr:hypothetical protein [Pseudomonadota bacterium]